MEAFVYHHAPAEYICPFCLIVRHVENELVWTKPSDIVYQDTVVTAFISAGQWPNTRGHVIVIPNTHYENIYTLPIELAHPLHRLIRGIAFAMKMAYGCAGISTRQHNEPAGNQDVWHYHVHVFPRYENDHLYTTEKVRMTPEERVLYADKLRPHIVDWL